MYCPGFLHLILLEPGLQRPIAARFPASISDRSHECDGRPRVTVCYENQKRNTETMGTYVPRVERASTVVEGVFHSEQETVRV